MAKRTLVQLAHTYKKQHINSWFISEKLDGIRCWWDGGISRGIKTEDVPYANTIKDARLVETPYATGLWSRSGKAKFAPDWFLNQLPKMPLDGELWLGRNKFQKLSSIVNSHNADWTNVKYIVFDSPPLETVLADGDIDIRMGSVLYTLKFRNCMEWVKEKKSNIFSYLSHADYYYVYNDLKNRLVTNQNVFLLQQTKLPFRDIEKILEEELNKVLDIGGEGLVIRNPNASYETNRSHNILKYKPFEDDEAIVSGYIWGRETEFGSKLKGLMGALVVNFNGKRLELSGFTDAERKMTFCPFPDEYSLEQKASEPDQFPGKTVSRDWHNQSFPIGSTITFRYRELSDDGIPKEARYYRYG